MRTPKIASEVDGEMLAFEAWFDGLPSAPDHLGPVLVAPPIDDEPDDHGPDEPDSFSPFDELGQSDKELVEEILFQFALGRCARRQLRWLLASSVPCIEPHHKPLKGSRERYMDASLRREAWRYVRANPRSLWREWDDEGCRDEARGGDRALVRYLDHTLRTLKRHQTAIPKLWRIPHRTSEDFREHARVELALGMCTDGLRSHERPKMAATVRFLVSLRDGLRTKQSIFEASPRADLADYLVNPETVSAETRAIDRQVETLAGQSMWRAQARMSRTQREWFNDFRADLDEHGKLNLRRVADGRDRDRASAVRARFAIRSLLVEEGAKDLLEP